MLSFQVKPVAGQNSVYTKTSTKLADYSYKSSFVMEMKSIRNL